MSNKTITITCNHCNTLVEAPICGITHSSYRYGYVLLQCGNCGNGSMLSVLTRNSYEFSDHIMNNDGNLTNTLHFKQQWPQSELKIPDGLPDKVSHVYNEAERAFEARIWEASIERYRKAIEQACKDKGQTSVNLMSKINNLHKSGQITKDLNEWAHHIRKIGNEAAHDDPLPDDEAQSEAKDIRLFCELFMTYVYSLPKKLEERRSEKQT